MTVTLGIDLATVHGSTGICTINWDQRVAAVEVGQPSDADLAARIREAHDGGGWVAIDAPFGFPAAFTHIVTSWQETGRAADASHQDVIRRLTDMRVHEVQKRVPPDILAGGSSWPLSSVVERITPTALRAMRLLTMLTEEGPADRIGFQSRIVETYPIAALRVWGVQTGNYKNDPNDAQHVLGRLCTATGFAHPDGWDDVKPTRRDDAVDAFTCALLARTVALTDGQTRPEHDADLATIAQEGWIHLPPPGHTLEELRVR